MQHDLKVVLQSIEESAEYFGIELNDVNQRGVYGNTPLKVAVVRGDVAAVRTLLRAGADVNGVLEDDFTALHHAAAHNRTDITQVLLEHGARRDMRNDDGSTPLQLARCLGARR